MAASEKFIIFLCSGAVEAGNKNLSFRIASHLETMGIAHIGNLQDLSEQHSASEEDQKRMIFINDCPSGCVKVFMQGFQKEKYLYFDVSHFPASNEIDIPKYIHLKILPTLYDTWNYSLSSENHSA